MLEKYSLLYVVGRTKQDLNIQMLLLEMAQVNIAEYHFQMISNYFPDIIFLISPSFFLKYAL